MAEHSARTSSLQSHRNTEARLRGHAARETAGSIHWTLKYLLFATFLCALFLVPAFIWSVRQSKPGKIRYVSGIRARVPIHKYRYVASMPNTPLKLPRRIVTRITSLPKNCTNLTSMPTEIQSTDNWMPIVFPSNDSVDYVFSAYLRTHQNKTIVVAVGTTPPGLPKFVGQLWFRTSRTKSGVYNQIVTCHTRPVMNPGLYKASLIICPFETDEMPFAVSFVEVDVPCSAAHNLLQIQDTWNPDENNTFAVCVKPLYGKHGGYNRTARLVEFIEMYRLFGASHFTVYHYALNEKVTGPILKYYQDANLLTLIPWQSPPNLKNYLRTYYDHSIHWAQDVGQTIAQTDCLYRSMRTHNYVAMVDVDEFIVPRGFRSFQQLLDLVSRRRGSLVFQNRFFPLHPNDRRMNRLSFFNDTRIETYQPRTQIVTRGEKIINKRPKYVVRAKGAWGALTHRAKLLTGFDEFHVPSSIGALHHYRENWKHRPTEFDSYMIHFKEDIMRRIESVFNETQARVLN